MLHPSVIIRKFLHVGHNSLLLPFIELPYDESGEVFTEIGLISKSDGSMPLLKLVCSTVFALVLSAK
jgi:hypothetical protein